MVTQPERNGIVCDFKTAMGMAELKQETMQHLNAGHARERGVSSVKPLIRIGYGAKQWNIANLHKELIDDVERECVRHGFGHEPNHGVLLIANTEKPNVIRAFRQAKQEKRPKYFRLQSL